MHENKSPWLHQLNVTREINRIASDIETDVVIIGAGIAGIATAFFTLHNTDKKVVLVESNRVAHGATGHNAGQATSYFERQLHELVSVFGLEKAVEGQRVIDEDAWKLLDEMYIKANLDVPVSRFVGYTGLTEESHVFEALENNRYRKEGGIKLERLMIRDDVSFLEHIGPKYDGLYEIISNEELMKLLETTNPSFTALLASQKGCFNSALLCNELVTYLLNTFSDRLFLYEKTQIEKIVLKEGFALLDAGAHTIKTGKAVLCTNGFESIQIFSEEGLDINRRFHTDLQGYVGYMSAYFEEMNKEPTALGYVNTSDKPLGDDEQEYFYLTRRPYEKDTETKHNLVTIGGPGHLIDHHHLYTQGAPYPEEMIERINDFLKHNYVNEDKEIEYKFTWHGLMGFTKNRVRMIGPDPKSDVLLYNLGCNGVGLLPSIYGGWKVAEIINGKTFEPSMFDVLG